MHAYDGMPDAKKGLGRYFGFFNDERPHQALGYSVPSQVYYASLAELHALDEAA